MSKYFIILAAMLLISCQHSSFQYQTTYPIIAKKLNRENTLSQTISNAKASGPMWSSCESLNKEAMERILADCDAIDCDFISNLHWYHSGQNKWSKDPVCKTEYGWAFGTLYTFWWPSATKVKVRANLVKATKKKREMLKQNYQENTIGMPSVHTNSLWAEPHTQSLGLELSILAAPDVATGDASINYAYRESKAHGWEINLNFGTTLMGPSPMSELNSVKLTGRWQRFIANSFYVGLGGGLQGETFGQYMYADERSLDSETINSKLKLTRQWGALTAGAELSLGNRWYYDGFYFGIEWLQIYAPFTILDYKENQKWEPETAENAWSPKSPSWRLLGFHAGLSF